MGTQNEDKDIDGLNAQERKFCDAFCDIGKPTCANATKSAIAAGYSEKSAHTCGWRLLRRAPIKQRVAELRGLRVDKVLSDLESTRLAALDKKDLAVATRCSELQGKSLKMFVERQEINAPAEELGMTAEEEQYQRDYAAWRLDQEALKSRQNIQFRSN